MTYDLKTNNSEFLLYCVDVILMRKAQYQEFLDVYESQGWEAVTTPKYLWQKLFYIDGFKIEQFDEEIAEIIKEIDSRGE